MSRIDVRHMGPGEYAVTVAEGGVDHHNAPPALSTHHRVRVDDRVLDDLAIIDRDPETEQRLVRESFEFLLEKEPASAIAREFDLSDIRERFADYYDEVTTRLA